jgi:hypothetical protein
MVTVDIQNFNVWNSSIDPVFSEICHQSRIPYRWTAYQRIANDLKYKNSIIKPINKYVESLYPAPKLISITDKEIILRQYSHAEVFILVTASSEKFLDRPWMRQFYNTAYQSDIDAECFDNIFVAYTPWVIDENLSIDFRVPDEETAFKIFETSRTSSNIPSHTVFVEPFMIPFRFKKVGPHMVDHEFGKVKRLSPIYDMVLPRNDIIDKRIEDFYANH